MFGLTDAQFNKVVLWAAKIGILIISAPATIGIVDMIYDESGKEVILFGFDMLWLIKLAALVMIEGAFLYFWQLVQNLKNLQNRDEDEQTVYVICAWMMYGVLLVVGFLHGEGLITLVLRFAMGLLLFVSTNDKLTAMRRKVETERGKGKKDTNKIRRKRAKAEEDIQVALIERSKREQLLLIKQDEALMKDHSTKKIQQRIAAMFSGDIVEGEIVEVIEENLDDVPQLPVPAPDEDFVEPPAEENLEPAPTKYEEPEQVDFVEPVVEPSITPVHPQATNKIEQDTESLLENDCYTVVRQSDGNVVLACKFCSYRVTKPSSLKDPYMSALRAGNKHCGKHKDVIK